MNKKEETQNEWVWNLSTWLLITLCILNYFDFATTLHLMENKAITEGNPLLVYFIEKFNTPWAIFWVKFFVISILFVPYMIVKKWRDNCQKPWVVYTLWFMNLYYLMVVIFNLNLVLA